MPADFATAAIEAASAPARGPVLTFPESLASLMKDRIRHPLGTHFGITNFGVNLTYLPPGSVSAPRHSHSHQDEFVYILEGTPILVTSAGEMPLRPGMCASFKAGSDNAHQLRNRSDTMAVYLEMGDRTAGDVVTYLTTTSRLIRCRMVGFRLFARMAHRTEAMPAGVVD